jgi:hypothetical protein
MGPIAIGGVERPDETGLCSAALLVGPVSVAVRHAPTWRPFSISTHFRIPATAVAQIPERVLANAPTPGASL